ncbi:MAG: hypothetical protein AAGA56_28835 [Myxococcota bacterium]
MSRRGESKLGRRAFVAATVASAGAFPSGCRTFQAPLTLPSRGGPVWHELSSERFVLRTDFGLPTAVSRVREFEESFQMMNRVALNSAPAPPERTEVVLFERFDDYNAVATPGSIGFFTKAMNEQSTYIVMYGPPRQASRQIFQHELAHRFLAHLMSGPVPVWLNQGLARYYETMEVVDGRVVLGRPGTAYGFRGTNIVQRTSLGTISIPLPAASELVRASAQTFYDAERAVSFYAGAWLLVSMLLRSREKAFWWFVKALARGLPPINAWRASFPELEGAALDQAYRRFAARGEVVVRRVLFEPRPVSEPRISPIPESEVETLWPALQNNVRRGLH